MLSFQMKRSILTLFVFLGFSIHVSSQFVDKYGIKLGVGFSSQLWDNKTSYFVSKRQDFKAGLSALVSAEKNLIDFLSVRSELGYIQKGFRNNLELTSNDGTSLNVKGSNVTFHNLTLNIEAKAVPFKGLLVPYFIAGFRTDYMLSYSDIVAKDPASNTEINMYKAEIDKFHSLNLSGIVAFGCEYNKQVYIEFEYCPFTTNSYNNTDFKIKDLYRSISIGYNLNSLFKR
jgi:hypothetical protein